LCGDTYVAYRAREFWANEQHWATHDFVTRGELHTLCEEGGFERVRISGYWIPYSRRLIRDAARRFRVAGRLGRWLVLRPFAAILVVEAQRGPRSGRPHASEENRLPKAPWAS
jgi:hypothetical protein